MTNHTPENVIDDSVVEAAYRAFCEARFGKALSDEEHDALRSRLELTWIKPTIAAALRAANMLREPGIDVAALIREAKAESLEEAADLAEGVECIVLDPVMEKIGKNVGLSLAQEFRARAAEYRKAVES